MMINLAVLLFLTSSCSAETTTKKYCRPHQDCWPPQADWDDLKTKVDGGLNKLDKDVYKKCYAQKGDAYGIEKAANGVCMQYHDCSKEFCVKGMKWNLPEYSVTAKTIEHVQEALKFANKFNIEVRIKTSGHSYAGSSTGKDTLLIWMYHFKKYDTIGSFENSCGTKYNKTIKVGGGETWHDVYGAITDKYNIVGGGGLSVSAAGGWLQGVGLSALSRYHGAGIDNVLWFEVVLADGTLVTADACENTDLFWALRGGGGGTFGVVTAVYYKLHPVQKVTSATMEIKNLLTTRETADGWLEKWVELSPKLDRRWGGYWTLNGYILYFVGNQTEAEATFLNKIYEWKNSLPEEQADSVVMGVAETNSYYWSRGGIYSGTDKTGQMEFNIYDRLVPRRWVEEDKDRAVDMLKWMLRNGFYTFNYVLGGAMEDVGAENTAVNPYMRKAIWQMEVFEERMIKKLRESVRDSGVGYNHAFKLEPDWENQFWGTNLARLQQLKKKFDPENRLNCWHCIGYVKYEDQSTEYKDQSTGSAALQKHSIFVVLLFSAVTYYFTFA